MRIIVSNEQRLPLKAFILGKKTQESCFAYEILISLRVLGLYFSENIPLRVLSIQSIPYNVFMLWLQVTMGLAACRSSARWRGRRGSVRRPPTRCPTTLTMTPTIRSVSQPGNDSHPGNAIIKGLLTSSESEKGQRTS